MIETARLAEVRADALRDLEGTGVTATVQTPGQTVDPELGGFVDAPVDGTEYPCMMQSEELEQERPGEGGRVQSRVQFYAILPFDAVVNAEDLLKVEGAGYGPVVWTVIDTNEGETNRFHLKVRVQEAD